MSTVSRRNLPSQRVLKEWLSYDPQSGIFTWIKEPKKVGTLLGKTAGTSVGGYRRIRVPGYGPLLAHRLAWVIINGATIGELSIDHIDGNRSNNAISNLRLATASQQNQNKRIRPDNRSGLKGAFYVGCGCKKKWTSQINVGGKSISLGYFNTPEEAHSAYCLAAKRHFGEFARTA